LLGAYQISKHAVEAIAGTLREELREFGIQVGCIEPGPHMTGWATTYARRSEVKAPYSAPELMARARCGYPIEPPEATLPFFWKMFDSPVMPKRIATSRPFVDRVVAEAEERIREWGDGYAQ
jgi:NAD(P)-dependent dehydrogenase (short-subunit alcohol dehydrogenase family)